MTTTLTDRYIAETLRGIRPESHDDVRGELTASIADAVDARIEQGEAPDAAEHAALNDLGDPALLAAGLADRPLQLIGPRYYVMWLRLLRLLLAIVPVCIAALATIDPATRGESIGRVIAEAFGAGVTGAMHVFFWTTLAIVIMERTNAASGHTREAWTVDRLPQVTVSTRGAADLIATTIVLIVAALGFWWDRAFGWIVLDGEAIAIFAPALWPWWMTGLFALFALIVLFQVVLFIRHRWTTALAVVNTALNALGVSWFLTLLGRGELFNDRLIEVLVAHSGVTDETLLVVAIVIGFAGAAIAAGGIVDGWVKRAKDSRIG